MKKIVVFLRDSRTLTFVVCLVVTLFLWTPMKLSKNLLRELSVPVVITNLPADKVLIPSPENNYMKLLAEGNGFALLKAYSQNPVLHIDFQDLQPIDTHSYCLTKNGKDKLNNSYLSNFRIRTVVNDTLQLNLSPKHTKRVPVQVQLNVEYAKEYQLTELRIEPDSVTVSGSKAVIDTLRAITFTYHQRRIAKENFRKDYPLKNTPLLHYNTHKVAMQAFVDKVSEQLLRVPVQVINTPAGSQVKVFPNEITLLCTGDLELLKTLTPNDVSVTANVAEASGDNRIPLRLTTKAKRVKISFFNETTVDFLIRKE
ncbi:hypothetical protein HMPREF9075_01722 [Capnocytophaga sp. oral taxon 332 str. F0381]|uniref:CdaR family protein n=1 Tax=Capnocytophaga sp. oral taxon 332 TaxID=712213 RepID=UPI0002A2BAE3|nr:YbbR-like domain-containing protein [Capnocytophaga sp. oral taxon 332]EKY08364.1 hypothetical protein HMPREF9075_01722 [Capnocytophaga sp. oral taxon 332 str. F0381]